MDLLHKILLFLHLLGMAAVVGGWIAIRAGRTVTPVVVWGARAQLVTGLLLVAFASTNTTDDWVVNNAKVSAIEILQAGTTVAVSVNPPNTALNVGQTQQFTASVTGSANTAVAWTLSPASGSGTVSSSGLYSAPAAVLSEQTVTVRLTPERWRTQDYAQLPDL